MPPCCDSCSRCGQLHGREESPKVASLRKMDTVDGVSEKVASRVQMCIIGWMLNGSC